MKSTKLYFILICFLGSLLFASCSDSENDDEQIMNSLVGEWNVDEAAATAFIDGLRIEGIDIETSGTITYRADGTGSASFQMTFDGESNDIIGSFSWVDLGFEVVWNDGAGEDEVRWTKSVDNASFKVMTFTHELEEDNTDELEITATLTRIN